ncbi:antirestriction protein ArdC [Variovorax paradoxus]|uniref:Antirestriction protein ArdC n=1 Tax=Variovorax paradoxus TaxID=34073 RepID=A0AAW8E7Q3_VARPD|nr:ArdC family protein [Variovorax paradoxus]MDP9968883.1 antirestriction protein ArdC [Variovorax paradoxus]
MLPFFTTSAQRCAGGEASFGGVDAYRGANVLLLWETAIEEVYASNVWLTYRQAQRLGAEVVYIARNSRPVQTFPE